MFKSKLYIFLAAMLLTGCASTPELSAPKNIAPYTLTKDYTLTTVRGPFSVSRSWVLKAGEYKPVWESNSAVYYANAGKTVYQPDGVFGAENWSGGFLEYKNSNQFEIFNYGSGGLPSTALELTLPPEFKGKLKK